VKAKDYFRRKYTSNVAGLPHILEMPASYFVCSSGGEFKVSYIIEYVRLFLVHTKHKNICIFCAHKAPKYLHSDVPNSQIMTRGDGQVATISSLATFCFVRQWPENGYCF
jgi:hypothetical protein